MSRSLSCTEILGLPIPESLQGKSLMPILKNPSATVRDTALSIGNRGPAGGLRAAEWHYMSYGEKVEELYDIVRDPHKYTKVVKNPAHAPMLK